MHKSTITFTIGPPGAGKSRWAHQEVSRRGLHEVQRVALDDFVTMLHGRGTGEISGPDFKLIRRMLLSTVRSIAESGRDVIIDDTHLSPAFVRQVRDELGDTVEYEIKDFTGIPLQECIDNDAYRNRMDPFGHVGEEEVRRQYDRGQGLRKRYGGAGLPRLLSELGRSDGIEPYEPDPALPKALIIDIDGTVLLHVDRGPYDTSRYHTDAPERRLARLLRDLQELKADGYRFLFLTGRYEEFRSVTVESFRTHGIHFDELHMRPDGDRRRDNEVKLELFNKHVRDRFNVIAAFDDRDRVVRLWRRLGLLTLQCNYGDF